MKMHYSAEGKTSNVPTPGRMSRSRSMYYSQANPAGIPSLPPCWLNIDRCIKLGVPRKCMADIGASVRLFTTAAGQRVWNDKCGSDPP